MKKIIIILAMLFGVAYGQTIGYLRYDSVKMAKNGGNTELILENASKSVTGGVLTNTGNGRTAFVLPSSGIDTTAWHTTGNSGTTAGTKFIGTTDAQGLMFKTNGVQSGYIDLSNLNTSFGQNSLVSNTFGDGNTAIGLMAMQNNTSGSSNVAIGSESLNKNTSGISNIAIGNQALYNNIGSGDNNFAMGFGSLYSNTTGDNNIGVGYFSGRYQTTFNNRLYINSIDRANILGDTTESIIYGVQDATAANQRLYINSQLYNPYIAAQSNAADSMVVVLPGTGLFGYRSIPSGSSFTPSNGSGITYAGGGAYDLGGMLTNDVIIDGATNNNSIELSGFSNSAMIRLGYSSGLTELGDILNSNLGTTLKINDDNSLSYFDNTAHDSKVGINTDAPDSVLDIVGGLKYVNGSQGSGKVLTSDANGGATWQTPSGGISGLTTNELVYGNSSTTIASLPVATYPSLTELSYVKGVTSGIQGQFANYLPLAGGTLTGALTQSVNGAVSAPAITGTGTWYTGGTATTTKPYLLIEPAGTTSTGWSTTGTGLGVNAATGFTGNLIDLQRAGARKFAVDGTGLVTTVNGVDLSGWYLYMNSTSNGRISGGTGINIDAYSTGAINLRTNGTTSAMYINSSQQVGVGTTSPNSLLHVNGSLSTGYVAKTATYTATASDHTIEATSGTFTVTLPTAVGITGRIYVLTNSGSGVLTAGTTSSQTFVNVSGTPTTLTLNQFSTVTVQSNGANWLRLTSL